MVIPIIGLVLVACGSGSSTMRMGFELGEDYPVELPPGATVVLLESGLASRVVAEVDPPDAQGLEEFFRTESGTWPGAVQRETTAEGGNRWTSDVGISAEVTSNGDQIIVTVDGMEEAEVSADALISDDYPIPFPEGGVVDFLAETQAPEAGWLRIRLRVAYPADRLDELITTFDKFMAELDTDYRVTRGDGIVRYVDYQWEDNFIEVAAGRQERSDEVVVHTRWQFDLP